MEIDKIKEESIEYLDKGIHNLMQHVKNIKEVFGLNIIVAINKYNTDTEKEIEYLKERLEEKGVELSIVDAWAKGGEGAKDLSEKIEKLCEVPSNFNYAYELTDSIEEKIEKISKKIYGASNVIYTDEALEKIKNLEKSGYKDLPVCIAKTQYSFSDDATNLLCDKPFDIHVKDVILKAGARFIVVLTGNIFTMPGLPEVPSAEKIDLDDFENIEGIF